MKYICENTQTLIYFTRDGEVVPLYFQYKDQRLKVEKVLRVWNMRKSFDECTVYQCRAEGKMAELRWDRVRNKWFIDKIGN